MANALRVVCFQSWYSSPLAVSPLGVSFTPLLETGVTFAPFQGVTCSALCAAVCRHSSAASDVYKRQPPRRSLIDDASFLPRSLPLPLALRLAPPPRSPPRSPLALASARARPRAFPNSFPRPRRPSSLVVIDSIFLRFRRTASAFAFPFPFPFAVVVASVLVVPRLPSRSPSPSRSPLSLVLVVPIVPLARVFPLSRADSVRRFTPRVSRPSSRARLVVVVVIASSSSSSPRDAVGRRR